MMVMLSSLICSEQSVGNQTCDSRVQDGLSQLFGLLLLPQQTDVQTQEGVTDAHGAVHRGRQQREEGKSLLPR